MALDIAEKLDEARALIEKGWTQKAYARGKSGKDVDPQGRSAKCFCSMGAVLRVTQAEYASLTPEYDWLCVSIGATGGSVAEWNDAPERTQAEVIEAFRKAAELARQEQSA